MKRCVASALLALVALVLLGGCDRTTPGAGASPSSTGQPSTAPGTPDSGIRGIALAGPQCPVERVDSPCPPKPIAIEVVVDDAGGRQVTTFRTNDDGTYRVALPAGHYVLRTTGLIPPTLKPTDAVVPTGQYVTVNLDVDTGIR
jgi:hypothetical protein